MRYANYTNHIIAHIFAIFCSTIPINNYKINNVNMKSPLGKHQSNNYCRVYRNLYASLQCFYSKMLKN